jgi:hypothetical protein
MATSEAGATRDLVQRRGTERGPMGLRPEEAGMVVETGTETRTSTVRAFGLREEPAEDGKGDPILKIDPIGADPGDTIRWDVGDRVVSIWFPERGLFVTPVLAMQHSGVIEATVPDNATHGVYSYCMYDHTSRRFVECQSHPTVEVPKP